MLLVGKSRVEDLTPCDASKIEYWCIEDDEKWRVGIINEINDVKFGKYIVDGFDYFYFLAILCIYCM